MGRSLDSTPDNVRHSSPRRLQAPLGAAGTPLHPALVPPSCHQLQGNCLGQRFRIAELLPIPFGKPDEYANVLSIDQST